MLRLQSAFVALVVATSIGCGDSTPTQADGLVSELAVWDESAWREIDVTLPSSSHPYSHMERSQWTLVAPSCAEAVRVRFGAVELEADYDFIHVKNRSSRTVQTITGSYDSFVTEPVPGNIVHLSLDTDVSVAGYGFDVEAVEAVGERPVCPRAAIQSCADGMLDNTPRPGLCACEPLVRDCQPIDSFSATLLTAGGFTGGGGGHRLTGDGDIFAESYGSDGYSSTRVATARPEQVRDLARWLVYNGFFDESGLSGEPANLTTTFGAAWLDDTRAVQWPAGAPTGAAAAFAEAVFMFEKTVACTATDDVGSTCVDSRVCVDGACVQNSCAGITCDEGHHCALMNVVCITSPCPPTAMCVPDETNPCAAVLCGPNTTCVVHDGEPVCEAAPVHCGGFAARPCPGAGGCTDDPSDDCDPAIGADCGGVCECNALGMCLSGMVWDPSPAVCGCVAGGDPGCFCAKIYSPVCGENGMTYGNACEAACAGAPIARDGECATSTCSPTAPCGDGEVCRYGEGAFEPPYAGATGTCEPHGFCDDVSDCYAYPHILCLGAWSCAENQCAFTCGSSSWSMLSTPFASPSPYQNDMLLGWELSVPGASELRVPFTSFDLETDYDFVIIYDGAWNELLRYSGDLGPFISEPIPGSTAYVVFSSDLSITAGGFSASGVEYH
jgi:hypothetical protein